MRQKLSVIKHKHGIAASLKRRLIIWFRRYYRRKETHGHAQARHRKQRAAGLQNSVMVLGFLLVLRVLRLEPLLRICFVLLSVSHRFPLTLSSETSKWFPAPLPTLIFNFPPPPPQPFQSPNRIPRITMLTLTNFPCSPSRYHHFWIQIPTRHCYQHKLVQSPQPPQIYKGILIQLGGLTSPRTRTT